MIDSIIEQMTDTDRPKLTPDRLAEIRSRNLARATAESIGLKVSAVDEHSDQQRLDVAMAVAAANAYFNAFLPVGPCPNCDRRYGFRWGLRYGDGNCECGYPARAYHNIEGVGTISNVILWFHPDELEMTAGK